MRRLLARFARDTAGLAALEFAIVAPVMILMHFGAVECIQAFEAYRRVTHIASAIADITAQNSTVTSAQMTDILNAGPALIHPFPSTPLGERVSSLVANSTGQVNVAWSVTMNYTATDTPAVPSGTTLAAGQSLIVADVTYSAPSLFALVLPKSIKMTRHAYLTPRLSSQVTKSG